jgi:hypothetical protein
VTDAESSVSVRDSAARVEVTVLVLPKRAHGRVRHRTPCGSFDPHAQHSVPFGLRDGRGRRKALHRTRADALGAVGDHAEQKQQRSAGNYRAQQLEGCKKNEPEPWGLVTTARLLRHG